MCIRVDTIDGMPEDLAVKLEQIRPELEAHDYITDVADKPEILRLLRELNEYGVSKTVVGIHRTRAVRESIQKNGLQPRSGQERREQFLRDHGKLFTVEERKQIREAFSEYYTPFMNMVRDNRVWFNLCREAPRGSERLLEYYGGEVVFMPLKDIPTICAKLRNIGEPLAIECRLHPDKIRGFWDYPVALVWLSAYHAHVNRRAQVYDVDLYSTGTIAPKDILSITALKNGSQGDQAKSSEAQVKES